MSQPIALHLFKSTSTSFPTKQVPISPFDLFYKWTPECLQELKINIQFCNDFNKICGKYRDQEPGENLEDVLELEFSQDEILDMAFADEDGDPLCSDKSYQFFHQLECELRNKNRFWKAPRPFDNLALQFGELVFENSRPFRIRNEKISFQIGDAIITTEDLLCAVIPNDIVVVFFQDRNTMMYKSPDGFCQIAAELVGVALHNNSIHS
jgi:hypothetical protein